MKVIHVNQVNENIEIQFRIMNGAQPFNVPEGVSCTIRGTKGDNFGYAAAVDVTAGSNIVTVTLTEQLTAVAGAGNVFELVFVGASDNMKVSTENFILEVERAALGEDTVISDSDLAYADQVLDQLQSVGAVNAQVQQNKANIAAEITRATAAEQTLQQNINAEAAARQAADNTLQSNINAEASSRATTDASLQSQIDQLVAPSGEAPSAAEVQNARIGTDGTVYPTLGDAIRTQNSDLKNALDTSSGSLNGEVFADVEAQTRTSNTDNYYMDATGTNVYNTSYVTDKFAVTAGDLLHITAQKDSIGVWCFRAGDGFSSAVVGNVMTAGGSFYVTVPTGATYLFISRKKTTATNTVYTAKSIVADNTNAININASDLQRISNVLNGKYQYLDSTLWTSKKYYSGVNTINSVNDAGYAVYPPLTLQAGTYYYQRINFGFTYASSASQQSYKPFNTTAGMITFTEETTLYITCQYPTSDYTLCMLSNGVLPSEYIYGSYGYGVSLATISKPVKVVDANGYGDYTTIQAAINACQDLDQYNVQTGIHETILVMPGTYPRFSMGAGGNGAVARRNISIIGVDRQKCIIRDDGGLYKYPPAEIRTDGTIANLTFIATHNNGDASTAESKDQYAVHLDYGYCEETFENCTFISYCNAAVGIGLYANEKLTFRNCTFESYADPSEWGGTAPYGIYCHTNTADGTANQNLTLIDCECISENSQYGGVFQVIANTDNSTQFLKLIRNLFYGNNGFSVNIQNGWDTSMSYGNSVEV